MELSLTGVSTRKSRKATLRASQKLIEMKESFRDLNISKKKHYCLMVTLVGESADYFRHIPNSDGIYQVEVGYGDNLEFSSLPDEATDSILFSAILDACWRVINSYPDFTSSEMELVANWFNDWRQKLE